jgi:hypothetical protein
MARRADADRRPTVVLYFSDFDPSGRHMPAAPGAARRARLMRAERYVGGELCHVGIVLIPCDFNP